MNSTQTNPQGDFTIWPELRLDELKNMEVTEDVGQKLLFQDVAIRVWEINLKPGERMVFHKHTTDYSWTALTAGRAVSYYSCGKIVEIIYKKGDISFYHHIENGDFIHDLENTGDQNLIFNTVEYILKSKGSIK